MSKVMLNEVTLNFPSLFEPTLPMGKTDDKDKKYQATFCFSKDTQKALALKLKKSADEVAVNKWGKLPDDLEYSCLKDGDS